jgi:protein-S-isoprenylcysteine O-methyltransferase Ste14
MDTYTNLIVWWIIFFSVHSIMASSRVKKMIDSKSSGIKSSYRLVFNIVSLILLVPIVYTYSQLPTSYIYITNIFYQAVGGLLSLAGVYILFASFKNYRTDEFFGTYQLKNKHDFHPTKLSRHGWNGIIRHPLYFGTIVLIAGLNLISPEVKLALTSLLVIGYLYIGTLWEEKKLISEFGQDYKDYKREVSMLIPLKWMINKFR